MGMSAVLARVSRSFFSTTLNGNQGIVRRGMAGTIIQSKGDSQLESPDVRISVNVRPKLGAMVGLDCVAVNESADMIALFDGANGMEKSDLVVTALAETVAEFPQGGDFHMLGSCISQKLKGLSGGCAAATFTRVKHSGSGGILLDTMLFGDNKYFLLNRTGQVEQESRCHISNFIFQATRFDRYGENPGKEKEGLAEILRSTAHIVVGGITPENFPPPATSRQRFMQPLEEGAVAVVMSDGGGENVLRCELPKLAKSGAFIDSLKELIELRSELAFVIGKGNPISTIYDDIARLIQKMEIIYTDNERIAVQQFLAKNDDLAILTITKQPTVQ